MSPTNKPAAADTLLKTVQDSWMRTHVSEDKEKMKAELKTFRDEAKQQLRAAIELILGTDEVLQDGYGKGMPNQTQHTRNRLRAEQRQRLNEFMGDV